MLAKTKTKNQRSQTIYQLNKNTYRKLKDILKGTVTVVKKTVTSIHNLIAASSFSYLFSCACLVYGSLFGIIL